MKAEKSIYFPGINALRFFAAFSVIVTHIELLKDMFGFENVWLNPLFFNLGGLGVYFFFVLSGFLITYLLLAEKNNLGVIHVKQFYIRRILRIWPLYYFIMLIGFFLIPLLPIPVFYPKVIIDFLPNLILFIFLLPNLSIAMYKNVPNIGHAWSIGVEEQFYIFWPWVILKSKNILKTLVLIILFLILIKVFVLILGSFYSTSSWYLPLRKFVALSKFECMAIGGIGAYFLFTEHRALKVLINKSILNVCLLAIPLLVYFTPAKIQDGIHLLYSVIFLIVILNVSKGKVKINLENKVLNYLGTISYGIYMYHFMFIPLVLYVLNDFLNLRSGLLMNVILYSSSIILSIGISALSFEFFEKKFIRLKSKFSFVQSGKNL